MFPRLQDFTGEWHVTRDIAHADGTAAQFEGRAVYTPDGKGLIYREAGHLLLATGHRMKAERVYIWAQGSDRTLMVTFEDGRPFHSIAPDTAQADHWCDPDTYLVHYNFDAWPDWSSRWQVTGPRKDYCMTTQYRRASRAL